jgi:hypothetical protein
VGVPSQHGGSAGVVANEIAGATFALAVLASIFAILAYAVSTRTPKIEPVLIFPNCRPNKPVVSKAQGDNAPGTPLQARVGIAGPLSIEVGLGIEPMAHQREHQLTRFSFVSR